MNFILIMTLVLNFHTGTISGGGAGGTAIATAEFSTLAACEKAGENFLLMQKSPDKRLNTPIAKYIYVHHNLYSLNNNNIYIVLYYT